MSDIVERLRAVLDEVPLGPGQWEPIEDAIAEIERLRTENTALKQALGYPVPADVEVVNNPFKCGMCEAKTAEVERLRKAQASSIAERGAVWRWRRVMSDVLERAKAKQRELAHATTIVIRLDLFEDMIAEIEDLQHKLDVLRQEQPAQRLKSIGGEVTKP